MTKPVSPELIRRQAEELHRFTIAEDRASELAAEVETINAAAFEAAQELDFDDEPVAFARLLRAARAEASSDE